MLGVRQKLMLGFAALLAVHLGTGIGSLVLLNRSHGTVERLMYENDDSVVDSQALVDALARMDATVEVAELFGRAHDEPGSGPTTCVRAGLGLALASAIIQAQAGNTVCVTIPTARAQPSPGRQPPPS